MLPILDAAGILKDNDIRKIDASLASIRRRFPQLQWKIWTVCLPPDTSLPLFGFWLLNACPFHEKETVEDRAWAILLLVNADNGQVAVVPGYAAEPFLSDSEWKAILKTMSEPWNAGLPAEAILTFLKESRLQFHKAWKRYGARRTSKLKQ